MRLQLGCLNHVAPAEQELRPGWETQGYWLPLEQWDRVLSRQVPQMRMRTLASQAPMLAWGMATCWLNVGCRQHSPLRELWLAVPSATGSIADSCVKLVRPALATTLGDM